MTPDEIKSGLEICSSYECNGDHVECPYITSTMCIMDMANDALAYINQLEQRLASVGKTCPEWISVEDRLPETGNLNTRDYNAVVDTKKRRVQTKRHISWKDTQGKTRHRWF